MQNPFFDYYEKLKKSTKLFFNKTINNIIFYGFWFLLISALVLIITFLAINGDQKYIAMLWVSIGLIIFTLVFFYIFQYIKRRIKYKLESKINFKWLYENNLFESKLIHDVLTYANSYDEYFINLHVELMNNMFTNSNLGNQYETYTFNTLNKQDYLLSICNIKDYNKKIFQKAKNINQLIFKKSDTKIDCDNLFITTNKKINEENQIFNLSKTTIDSQTIFANNVNEKKILNLINIIKSWNVPNIDLSIRIFNNEVFFIINTELDITFQNENWFSKKMNYFIELFNEYNKLVLDIFKIID